MFLGQFFVIVNLIVPRILAQIDPNFEFLIFETSSIQIYKKNLRIRSSLDICVRSIQGDEILPKLKKSS